LAGKSRQAGVAGDGRGLVFAEWGEEAGNPVFAFSDC
jgi:hypothetical protein